MDIKKNLNVISAIVKKELAGYFGSAVAYVFIVIFLMLMGYFTFFISNFYTAGQADLRSFFEWHPWLYLFLIPAVAMHLWAEERRHGTIELMLTFPVLVTEAIVGKFLAAWIFIGIALALSFPVVLTTLYLGDPDMGVIISGYVGSFLLAGAFLSVGLMTSSITRSQVISFILSVIICLFFILAGFAPVTGMISGWAPIWFLDIVSEMSFLSHYHALGRGVLDMRDILYYGSVIFFMLCANGVILQARKAS